MERSMATKKKKNQGKGGRRKKDQIFHNAKGTRKVETGSLHTRGKKCRRVRRDGHGRSSQNRVSKRGSNMMGEREVTRGFPKKKKGPHCRYRTTSPGTGNMRRGGWEEGKKENESRRGNFPEKRGVNQGKSNHR